MSKVGQKRQRNDRKGDGIRTRVSFQRANRLGNKHPVRTIFETETHFVLLLRSWSNELFERYTRRVIELVNYSSLVSLAVIKGSGSEMVRVWYGTVVESNWARTLIEIGCSKFLFFDCIWQKYISVFLNYQIFCHWKIFISFICLVINGIFKPVCTKKIYMYKIILKNNWIIM